MPQVKMGDRVVTPHGAGVIVGGPSERGTINVRHDSDQSLKYYNVSDVTLESPKPVAASTATPSAAPKKAASKKPAKKAAKKSAPKKAAKKSAPKKAATKKAEKPAVQPAPAPEAVS